MGVAQWSITFCKDTTCIWAISYSIKLAGELFGGILRDILRLHIQQLSLEHSILAGAGGIHYYVLATLQHFVERGGPLGKGEGVGG